MFLTVSNYRSQNLINSRKTWLSSFTKLQFLGSLKPSYEHRAPEKYAFKLQNIIESTSI